MGAFITQLGLDSTFFIQFFLIIFVFFITSRLYFYPFLKLFETRKDKILEYQRLTENFTQQAQQKQKEYEARINFEKEKAKKELELVFQKTRVHYAELLKQTSEQARQMTQTASKSLSKQKDELKLELEKDVDSIAQMLTQKILSR